MDADVYLSRSKAAVCVRASTRTNALYSVHHASMWSGAAAGGQQVGATQLPFFVMQIYHLRVAGFARQKAQGLEAVAAVECG